MLKAREMGGLAVVQILKAATLAALITILPLLSLPLPLISVINIAVRILATATAIVVVIVIISHRWSA